MQVIREPNQQARRMGAGIPYTALSTVAYKGGNTWLDRMFQIIGAMAEFERALIQEPVRAGLRNARTKGRRLRRRE
jgi:DNA invertase Pin-like site-specific DNA recombinase